MRVGAGIARRIGCPRRRGRPSPVRRARLRQRGETIYRERCAGCHDLTNARIPRRDALKLMPAARILRALDFGVMMNVAYPMRRDEREAVATFLGSGASEPTPPAAAYCADRTVKLASRPNVQWNGWSPRDTNTRFQPGDAAGLTADQLQRLELKWAFAFDGDVSAFAQPTVLDRDLFVGSAGGVVHALSVDTGCLHWIFQANGPVRSAILAVPLGQRHALLFSDLTGWFYALEAETGKLLWKKRIDDHEATRLTGRADCSRRHRVHSGRVLGGIARDRQRLRLLHVSRQRRRAARARRIAGLERAHDSRGAQADGNESIGHAAVGTVGCGHLGDADNRREARPALRHHRRQLLDARQPAPATRSWPSISRAARSHGRGK